MSQEIINVLNYIGEKIGIAIDWTSANIMPQVLDVLGRYRIFQIVGLSIWMIVFITLAMIFIYFGKQIIPSYQSCSKNKEDNLWFWWSSYWNEIKWHISSCVYLTLLIIYLIFALFVRKAYICCYEKHRIRFGPSGLCARSSQKHRAL